MKFRHNNHHLRLALMLFLMDQTCSFHQPFSTKFSLSPLSLNGGFMRAPINLTARKGVKSSHVGLQPPVRVPSSRLDMAGLVSYKDFSEDLPSQQVIDAVDQLASKKGNKIIAADVAAQAGVSISQARRDLTRLATLTQGDIAVSRDGELIYTFPSSVKSTLLANSSKYKLQNTLETKVYPVLFYGLRVSFGVALLASIALIFTTIAFISAGGGQSDEDRRDNRRSNNGYGGSVSFGGPLGGFWGPSPFDFFYYRPYGYYYTRPSPLVVYRDARRGGRGFTDQRLEEMGFLESVFSYIFGDGDPNVGLEERRIQMASKVIRANNGAVTAEQLAPFCDEAPLPGTDEDTYLVDEKYVLPIVAKLGGEPRVTDEGEIVYVFPEMQLSAAVTKLDSAMILERAGFAPETSARDIKRELDMVGIDTRGAYDKQDLVVLLDQVLEELGAYDDNDRQEPFLQEKEWKFSEAGDLQKFLAGGLGVVNLGGALYLGQLLSNPILMSPGIQLPSYFGVVQTLYPFLLAYAVLFNVIPLARNFWIKRQNEAIRQRNQIRRSWFATVQASVGQGMTRIGKKLREAQSYGKKLKRLGAAGSEKDIIFDTKQDAIDREAIKQSEEMKKFDDLLNKDWN